MSHQRVQQLLSARAANQRARDPPPRCPSAYSRHALSAEGGGDLLGQQLHRAVVGRRAREHQEVTNPQIAEGTEHLGAPLGRRRQEPSSEQVLVDPGRRRPLLHPVLSLCLGFAEDHRHTELLPDVARIAPEVLAVLRKHIELVSVLLLGHQERVPPIGYLGHHPERPPLPVGVGPRRGAGISTGRLPGPPSEPDVRLSPHPALRGLTPLTRMILVQHSPMARGVQHLSSAPVARVPHAGRVRPPVEEGE